MSTTTTNLNLVKPGYADAADIGDINGNMDILDAAYASQSADILAREPILAKGALIGTASSYIDLDTYFDTGYYFVTVNSYIYNAPVAASAYGYFEVLKMTNNVTMQRFTKFGDNTSTTAADTYVRYYTNNTWYDWTLISNSHSGTENMIWGGDDLRFHTDSTTTTTDLPYPFTKAGSTYTGSASCLGYNRDGITWNSGDSTISGETDKYCTYNLGYVPAIYPFTVTMYFKQGSYYGHRLRAVVNSDSDMSQLLGSGSTEHAGYVKTVAISGSVTTHRILQWVIGKSSTMSADYDGRYLYNVSGSYVVAIRCDSGDKQYNEQDMQSFMSSKETLYDKYLGDKIVTQATATLTKGELGNVNLNSYNTTGLYYVTVGSGTSNAPVASGNYGYLEVWKMADGALIQRFTLKGNNGLANTGATFVRFYAGSTWYNWVRLNDKLTENLILGGNELSGRYTDDNVHIDPPYPIVEESTTYSNQAECIATDKNGMLWNGDNATISTERNKNTTYTLCEVSGNYPISVTFLLKNSGSYVNTVATATVTSSSGNYPVLSGTSRLGYLKISSGKLQWVVGRSAVDNDQIYDAYFLYNLGSGARIAAIHCEYGDRVYTKDEMIKMLSKRDLKMMQYTDKTAKSIYDNLATTHEYSGLNTTSKNLVGAINEILARL